ncbi:T9SS type B sorting domain-containing protein [Psychroflexus sp. ALD_RP9]|uniref:T9SS type B sorting domain-containing protein n=1 Tax=Psychroflexus sp. ALD_RP9 TaxID=2777186 RepID=UPI001A8EFB2A|nr:T9SS type B sorting domain-containing protein [Psychroflexus sp. ALD_RP9]QSS97488.1 T9SS type B sorting domain-containing protein [Psychroflexus sp. ALD_RP9]
MKLLVTSIFILFFYNAYSQLGFCSGNTGNPIFTENFGQGLNNGPPLPPGTTTYNFINANNPQDGQYTISNSTFQFGWNMPSDHTPNDSNGKALIVNADENNAGEFFRTTINGLCENNSYEFSAWLINILPANNACPGTAIPVNVKFQIWDSTDTNLLAEGDTGNINSSNSPTWQQYGLTFSTLENQTEVILKMINNGTGGCGNDLAIDDIVFRSCGDETEVVFENQAEFSYCENETFNPFTINAIPDFSIYDSHFYQWQVSQDLENWSSIPGETNSTLTITNSNGLEFYRALVAEDEINVENNLCNSISNVFTVEEIEISDPVSLGNVEVCEGETQIIAVQENPNITVNWYDAQTNGNLLAENSFTYQAENEGTYYAEAISVNGSCVNSNRIPITYSINSNPPEFTNEIVLCEGESATLTALEGNSFNWSNGETNEEIEVNQAGQYSVEVTNVSNCTSLQIFNVEINATPVIESVESVGSDIQINLQNNGDFSYAINNQFYQDSPYFSSVKGGLKTIIVSENNGCGTTEVDFLHLVVPKFFTPNNDGINDVFKINDANLVQPYKIQIFNRYGKLLTRGENENFSWNGQFNGQPVPSGDYWYNIVVGDKNFTGHFTLKR